MSLLNDGLGYLCLSPSLNLFSFEREKGMVIDRCFGLLGAPLVMLMDVTDTRFAVC